MSCISGQTILEEKLKLLRREKADTEYVDAQLLLLNSYVNTKANTSDVTTALALKANAADVTTALALKANAADVTTSLALKANTSDVTSSLALKANAADVTTSLALKANAADVTTALALKANTSDVTTSLALKANAADVTTSLALKVNTTDYTAALALKVDRTADGKVGIGTTTPSEKLTIVGGNILMDGSHDGMLMNPGTGAGSLAITRGGTLTNNVQQINAPYTDNVGSSSGGGAQINLLKNEMSFSTYPNTGVLGNPITVTERMRITSTGVGIGTTTPETKLDVVGNSIQCSHQGRFKGWYSGSQGSGLATEIGTHLDEGYINTYNRTTGTYGNALNLIVGSAANIKLTNSGNVGINTFTPNYKLHVEGSGTANEVVGWFNNQGSFSSSIAVRQSSKTAYITNHNGLGTPNYDGQLSNAISYGVSSGASPIQFWNGNTGAGLRGTAKLTILENGNVGIGTNAPLLTLDVAGGLVGNSAGDLTLNVNSTGVGGALKVLGGSGILSTSSGGFASKHLVITINGTVYKIKLENA